MGREFDRNDNSKFIPFLKERDYIGRLIKHDKPRRKRRVKKVQKPKKNKLKKRSKKMSNVSS